jgi:hypothetical protein
MENRWLARNISLLLPYRQDDFQAEIVIRASTGFCVLVNVDQSLDPFNLVGFVKGEAEKLPP